MILIRKNLVKIIFRKVKNKYGKLLEYKIIESNFKRNRIEIMFTRKARTYSETDNIVYLIRIIHHQLEIKCKFYDLIRRFATISLRNECEIKDVVEV